MDIVADLNIHMWFVLALTVLAIALFAMEKLPIEGTCVALLTLLLVFGQFFPLYGDQGRNLLDAKALLSGFANPSLIAVLCLLIIGQGITQTDALRPLSRYVLTPDTRFAWLSIISILLFVSVASAFMNNTPLVIIAIPLIQLLAQRMGLAESRLLIPLSYVAILGGMTTLVGSSTNLLVASTMREIGYQPLEFFDFVIPGAILAGIGLVYVIGILPRLLPDRRSLATQLVGGQKKFIAELDVGENSKLIGMECVDGIFPEFPELDIRLIQRSGHLILPPFEEYQVQKGDTLIVAATRDALASMLSKHPGFLLSEDQARMVERRRETEAKNSEDDGGERDELERQVEDTRILAEVMVPPGSRLIDMAIEHVGFDRQYGVIILGVQRRARVVRRRLGRIRLEPGDVLLLVGNRRAIDSLHNNQDLIILSGSKTDLPVATKAPVAGGIFVGTIVSAATGVLSIPVAAILGSVLMLVTGCLNIRQATRAVDRKIFLLVGSMLALGTALEVTGGALYIAEKLFQLPYTDIPLVLAAILFLLVAIATNVLTNNACAILFTPIALNLASNAGIDPHIFAITVVLGANCSFASPIGYQTNLLVMGPGHYRFRDFMKAGVPLLFVMWISYIFVARYYFGL